MDSVCNELKIVSYDTVDSSTINNIITRDYKTYSKMKALGCLVQTLINNGKFLSTSKKEIDTGSFGTASSIFFNKSKLVVKENSQIKYTETEYAVGSQLNVLRQYTPCFSYVLGRDGPKVIYEYGGGTTLQEWMADNADNTPDFLLIVIQVLLSLEIAQIKYRYIHNDLHSGNILIRDVRDSYTIVVGDAEYRFNNVLVPCIIDYGMSCIKGNGKDVLTQIKQVRGLVQGFDAYFLMAEAVVYSPVGTISTNSLNIINGFYKTDNPYSPDELKDNVRLEAVYTTLCAVYTPIELVHFILKTLPVSNLMVAPRTLYLQQKPPNNLKEEYVRLLGEGKFRVKDTDCSGGCVSFIVAQYFGFPLDNKYEYMEHDRTVILDILNYIVSEDAQELMRISNGIIYTPIKKVPSVSAQGLDKLFKMFAYINLFNSLYYMDTTLEFKHLFAMRRGSDHFANTILYGKAVRWYMTLEAN